MDGSVRRIPTHHLMDPREELGGVELYEMDGNNANCQSLPLQPNSLESSSSRVSSSPGSAKEMSTGTVSTMSTFDCEDVNFSGTSIVLK